MTSGDTFQVPAGQPAKTGPGGRGWPGAASERRSSFPAVRLIFARCEVHYTGRLTAVLPEALRLLMVKSDGSVMVHADTGGSKPQSCGLPL